VNRNGTSRSTAPATTRPNTPNTSIGERQVTHIYRLRAALEGLAAVEAAQRQLAGLIAPAELRGIRDAADDVERAIEDGDAKRAAQANLTFHRAIGGAAANPFLGDALHRVWDRIAVATVSNLSDQEWAAAVVAEHRSIYGAIDDGDVDAARTAAERHINAAAHVYRSAHR
jgi:DNA-binding FadR family transcriptional regulator